jgi:diguanylate cyclase (GGDEF)-like protein/PAS domain S-box-containing protein
MTRSGFSPRVRIGLWVVALMVLTGGTLYWVLQKQYLNTIDSLLNVNTQTVATGWRAVQTLQHKSVTTYHDEYIQQPIILEWLARAQDPAQRDTARTQLYRQLVGVYQRLQAQGIGQVYVHLPDGETLLRMHQPDLYGDNLTELRPSIAQVNTLRQPVFGLELGRLAAGYRSVFPVIDAQGKHLGNVEFSVTFRELQRSLQAIAPRTEFELVLHAARQQAVLLPSHADNYRPWQGQSAWTVKTSSSPGSEAPLSLSQQADHLAAQAAQRPEILQAMRQGEADSWRLNAEGQEYLFTHTPISDLQGNVIGHVLAYTPENALLEVEDNHRLHLWVAGLALLLLGGGCYFILMGALVRLQERKQAQEQIKLAASVFSHSRDGITITDPQGNILDVNDAFTRITGYSREEVLGQNPRILQSGRQDPALYKAMWNDLGQHGFWEGEVWNRRKNGEIYAEILTITAVRNNDGSTSHYMALFSDITRQKENEHRLRHIAHYDALTGLPNRVLLADRLAQAMTRSRRSGKPLALLFVDLDGFKSVNDAHGHNVGDHLLVTLSRRMQETLREFDTVARLGGDEFAVVLTDLNDRSACEQLVQRLLEVLSQPLEYEGLVLQVSGSIGATFYPQSEDIDADQLLRQADHAMYQAKLAGKNRHHLFDAVLDNDLRQRHEVRQRIARALEKGEFVLHYQPKVQMRTGQVVGAEALIRWQHPEDGLRSPGDFLPDVSDHALELDISRWVMGEALRQVQTWQAQGLALPVSVNVPGQHLQHPEFVNDLRQILSRFPSVPEGFLELEVLESSALDDIQHISEVIEQCTALGVSVALDDFGTGYSSLTYLRRLPAQTLKIDQTFVRDMLSDPDDLAILQGVLGLARAFQREAIAEGVETEGHGQMLLQLGCELGQGYGIARPMPAEALPD